MTDFEKVLEKAIKNFNWKKVQKTMEFLNWTWNNKKTVPTILEMQDTVRKLFNDAIQCAFVNNSKAGTAGTGGFEVKIENYINDKNENHYWVNIKFILECCDEDDESYEP